MVRTVGLLGSLASIGSLGLALALAPGFARWFYPLPLVLALTAALIAALFYIASFRRRPAGPDQDRLDRVLSTLPREAIRRIEAEDFAQSWPRDLTYPVDKYLNELGSVEHRFGDRALDKRLDRLRKTAADFCHTEAYNGFVSREVRDYRNVGWPPIEVEGDPKKEALADKRSSKIHKEAEKFVEAHNGLVKAAKRRG